jgi:hypothetical protein
MKKLILVSDWLLLKKIFSSETAWQNGAKLGRKHLCNILYKASSYLLVERNEMEKLYRRPYIDAYCQVWFHFAKQFQRRRFFLTVANQKQELPLVSIFVGGTERNDC